MNAHTTPEWHASIRPWRVGSASFAAAQGVGIVAAFVLAVSERTSAYAACALVLLLELVKWAVERLGLLQVPEPDIGELYAAAPLEPGHRALLASRACRHGRDSRRRP